MSLRNGSHGTLSLANRVWMAPAQGLRQRKSLHPGALILGFHNEMAPRVSHVTLTPDVIVPSNWAWDSLVDLLV